MHRPVGILAAQCAQHRGASKVILIDQVHEIPTIGVSPPFFPHTLDILPSRGRDQQEQYRLDFAERRLDPHTLTTLNGRQHPVAKTIREMLPHGPDVCIEVKEKTIAGVWMGSSTKPKRLHTHVLHK